MTFFAQHVFGEGNDADSGWLFGIPNPFPFDIFGGGIWGSIDPFPRGPTSARRTRLPDVISEIPAVVLPEIPEGWETVVIGGVERIRVPDVYNPPDARPGVFEPFDPGVVIGEVQGPDTASQEDVEGEEMAHDWGHLAREFLGGLIGPETGGGGTVYNPPDPFAPMPASSGGTGVGGPPGDCDGMSWSGGAPPKGYKVVRDNCGNGVLRKVRRRRRRRMLTSGDKDDIASIVSMVGKGQMAAALINGSMRRG